jgi:hypothetical protein
MIVANCRSNHCEGVAVALEAAPESNGSDELKQTI